MLWVEQTPGRTLWKYRPVANPDNVSGIVITPNGSVPHDERPQGSNPNTSRGFETHEKLVDHWGKHGAEFGTITIDDYLKLAQQLRDAPVGGDILEIVREDGVASRFDRASGAFLAFNPDRTIRTFFKPNDGERYFQRQARR